MMMSKEQRCKYLEAISLETLSSVTDDPYVNYFVDKYLDEESYLEEIRLWKECGGFLITKERDVLERELLKINKDCFIRYTEECLLVTPDGEELCAMEFISGSRSRDIMIELQIRFASEP